jgi:ATP-dependent helicase/nuclease subunit B
MADPATLFALPPGADFPAELVAGILQRYKGPPEALARITLIVNTQRMRRRVSECLQAQGARLLPRILLITEVAALAILPQPAPVSPTFGPARPPSRHRNHALPAKRAL